MRLVNTYINDSCTRKALVYCDRNNHYHLKLLGQDEEGWKQFVRGRLKFKHIESLQRAVAKWLKN